MSEMGCVDCDRSGYATSIDGQVLGTCGSCDGNGYVTAQLHAEVGCVACGKPAKRLVVYISRRTRQPRDGGGPMCDEHVQRELTLGASNLSMVDIDIRPLVAL